MADHNHTHCSTVREALSALADHEATPLPRAEVDAHLAGCADCAAYADRVGSLAEAMVAIPATDAPDLSARILAAGWPPETARARLLRWGIAAMAAGGLASTLWALGLQLYRSGPDHAGHESAALTVALWVGFALVAARPGLARPYLPITAMAAVGLLLAATVDLVAGRVAWTDEIIHVNLLAAWVMTWLLARELPDPSPAPPRRGALWALPRAAQPR